MRLRYLHPALLGLFLLAACASPAPRYYTLEPVAGTPLRGPAKIVVVRRVTVPHYLERDEIVREAAGGRVRIADNDWWSEPLRQMLQRVLAADMAQRLPDASVLGAEAISGTETSVVLAVDGFEPDGRGAVALNGFVVVDPAGREQGLHRVSARVPLAGDSLTEQVTAMSGALAAVADAAARMVSGR